jgi:hypothetical protein
MRPHPDPQRSTIFKIDQSVSEEVSSVKVDHGRFKSDPEATHK